MISLMLHEVRVRRRMIFWWAVGLAAFGLMYLGFYPSVEEEFGAIDIESIELYKAMGVSGMATFEDYFTSTLLNILPLLVGAFGIVLGTGALAGEEGAGTLELLVTLPLSRFRLYVAKSAAMLITSVVVSLALAAIVTTLFVLLDDQIDTSVTTGAVFWALTSLWLVAFVFLSLGLFLGALLPSRGTAAAAAAAILVATFFGNNLAAMVEALERVQPLCPSYWHGQVAEALTDDISWDAVLVLLLMGIVPLVAGAFAFRGRDLMVGAWPWQGLLPAAGHGTGNRGRVRSRRVVGSLAVAALVIGGCAAVAAIALAASDDLRADVRDRLGIVDSVTESGNLEAVPVAAVASAAGQVVSVPVSVGDEVDAGDILVVLAADGASARAIEAQQVMDDAWKLLDEVDAGEVRGDAARLRSAVARADATASAADRAWREGRAAAGSSDAVAELEMRAEMAWSSLRIAEARLALAEGRLSEADVLAIAATVAAGQADAMIRAQDGAQIGAQGGAQVGARDEPAVPTATSVVAPSAGVVTALLVRPSSVVTAGQTVALVTGDDRVMVAIRISEDDADRLEVGQGAEIDAEDVDEPLDGEIVAILEAREDANATDLASMLRGADLGALAETLGLANVADLESLARSLAAQASALGLDPTFGADIEGGAAAKADEEAANDADDDDEDIGADDRDEDSDKDDDGDQDDNNDADDDDEDDDRPFVVLIEVDDPDGLLDPGTEVDVRIEMD